MKSKNIEMTGWIERTEAMKGSYNADVFLLTSLWEGLLISLLAKEYAKIYPGWILNELVSSVFGCVNTTAGEAVAA